VFPLLGANAGDPLARRVLTALRAVAAALPGRPLTALG